MLKSLEIKNFRCFEFFRLEQLGQVNLLVGSNNSGKTSILEAIQLLSSPSDLEALCKIMIDRGEYIFNNERRNEINKRQELDIRHLFYNHELKYKIEISILGKHNEHQQEQFICLIQKHKTNKSINVFEHSPQSELVIDWVEQKEKITLGLSANQRFMIAHMIAPYMPPVIQNNLKFRIKREFVKSSSLGTDKMMELFDRVVLTPEEDVITEALRTIEPSIDRIAPITSQQSHYSGSRSGFVVRVGQQRVPIGSMGDGIWRILGLILAIVNVKDGVLLVDEIDTGLHYSVMLDMWTIICKVAKRLNVQVFATTHNSDCWKSLAAVANSENALENGITIQRIEKGKPASIIFDEEEMMIAAERDIEVR